MENLLQDGYILHVSGQARGKLSERIFHLLSSNDGKYYICNPNTDKLYEISSIEQINSIQDSSIQRINVCYKKSNTVETQAISIKTDNISKTAIARIKDYIRAKSIKDSIKDK